MNEQHDDTELERYLDGESGESRAYAELGDETPPPELDARIVAEAESAVKVTPLDSRRAPPLKAFAWAAIIVLSFSLVLNIVFEQAAHDPLAELESKGKRSAAPAASPEPMTARSRADMDRPRPGDSEEVVVSARKMEPALPQSAMVARDQPVGSVDQEPARQDELLELRQQFQEMGRSADEAAELYTLRENAVAEGEADTLLADDLLSPTSIGGDAQDEIVLTMEIVADHLAEAEAEGRSNALASLAAGGEDPRAELTRILDSYNDGRAEEASAALAEFRNRYPEHALSVTLKERGL